VVRGCSGSRLAAGGDTGDTPADEGGLIPDPIAGGSGTGVPVAVPPGVCEFVPDPTAGKTGSGELVGDPREGGVPGGITVGTTGGTTASTVLVLLAGSGGGPPPYEEVDCAVEGDPGVGCDTGVTGVCSVADTPGGGEKGPTGKAGMLGATVEGPTGKAGMFGATVEGPAGKAGMFGAAIVGTFGGGNGAAGMIGLDP
jgi:hypothetical protein